MLLRYRQTSAANQAKTLLAMDSGMNHVWLALRGLCVVSRTWSEKEIKGGTSNVVLSYHNFILCPFSNVSQILPQDAPYYQHLFEQAHPLTKIAANFDEKMEEHAMEEEATVESEDKASYFNVEVKPGGNISEEDEEESGENVKGVSLAESDVNVSDNTTIKATKTKKKKKKRKKKGSAPSSPKKPPIILGQWTGWGVFSQQSSDTEVHSPISNSRSELPTQSKTRSQDSAKPVVYGSLSEASGGPSPLEKSINEEKQSTSIEPKSAIEDSLANGNNATGGIVMQFANGETCFGGIQRSVDVFVTCHLKNEILRIDEDGLCKYELYFGTPAACSARRALALELEARAINETIPIR